MALYIIKEEIALLRRESSSYIVYDTETAKIKKLSPYFIETRAKRNENYIANAYVDMDGVHVKGINAEDKHRFYDRQLKMNGLVRRYIVALGCNWDQINYIACGKDDIVRHMVSTLGEMVKELDVAVEDLIISNATFKVLEDGSSLFNMINMETGEENEGGYTEETDIALAIRSRMPRYTEVNISVEDGEAVLNVDYNGLGKAVIPKEVTKIGSIAGVNRVVAGKNTDEVMAYAMCSDEDIKEFDFNNSVSKIGAAAFKDSMISRVTNIESVRYIGREAFSESLVSGEIKTKADVIGDRAFYYTPVKSVELNGTRVVGRQAFRHAYNLKTAELGEALEEIGEYAFADTPIKSVTIPKACAIVKNGAFKGCKKLREAHVHTGTYIEPGAFDKNCRIIFE